MSAEKSFCLNKKREEMHPRIPSRTSRVDLNSLMERVKEEEKRNKRNNLAISAAAISAVTVFGIILTL